jgi:tetratricopeptide (TPR) repeat protein
MTASHQQQINQAKTHLKHQQYQPVVDLCEYVLRHDKRNYDALQMLGRANFGLSRLDAAAQALEQALRVRAGDAQTHLLLGRIHTMRAAYAKALRHLNQVLNKDPHHRDALLGKAIVYDRQRNDQKLSALIDALVAQPPVPDELLLLKANALQRSGQPDAAMDILNSRYQDVPPPDTLDARVFLLQRGRLNEQCGRYEAAFRDYVNGQPCGRTTPYSMEEESKRIDRLIDVFSPDALASMPVATQTSELPVFIVGMPRTGSTLVERIISAHPQAVAAGEIILLNSIIRDMAYSVGAVKPFPDAMLGMDLDDVNTLGRLYVEQLQEHDPRAVRITDKLLNNYERVGLITRILPNARIIHVQRDPLDTCISILGIPFPPSHHPYQVSLEWLGFHYRQYLRLIAHWNTVLPNAMLTIQYEDLIADQESWTRRILEHIGLPWDDRCLTYYTQKQDVRTASREQVTKPVYSSSVGRSARFGALLDPLRAAIFDP